MYKCYPESVAAVAETQKDYFEKDKPENLTEFLTGKGSKNFTKYADDLDRIKFYGGGTGIKQGAEWCTVFDAWCIWIAAGMPEKSRLRDIMCVPSDEENLAAGAVYWKRYFEKAGRYGKVPHIGDICFFATNQAKLTEDHVGIVTDISEDGNVVYTVEGNKDNHVSECVYALSYWKILGFGTPRYDIPVDNAAVEDLRKQYTAEIAQLHKDLEDQKAKMSALRTSITEALSKTA